MELKIVVGGEAGQGIQTIAGVMSRFFLRSGYFVFTEQSYQSRIRGGHNFTQIRVSTEPIYSSEEGIDILVALNEETISLHRKDLSEEGIIIYDGEHAKGIVASSNFLDVPLQRLAVERAQNRIASNLVACGALVALLDGDFSLLEELIKEDFHNVEIAQKNIQAAKAGYEVGGSKRDFKIKTPFISDNNRLLIDGGQAVGFGAIVAGCRFLSAYPMTPGSAVMNYIASHSNIYNIVVEQAEDEISAINMILGASFAGVRSMVTTSGGGFALMVEGLSLAGMTETPCVIHIGQRPGPATGLPTRTEQGELLFVVSAGHGEFPRYIVAPRDAEDAFYKTIKAFNLADKYQVPSIILTDQYLIDSMLTVEGLDLSNIVIDRSLLEDVPKDYKRHLINESGISPRILPGKEGALVITDSDEHDEEGHITEDLEIRKRMVEKRLRKAIPLMGEIEEPVYLGKDNPDVLLVGWGSTYGILREAIERLTREGFNIGLLHFSDVYPLPQKKLNELKDVRRMIAVENNATGQFAQLVKRETGIDIKDRILKYNGSPFTPLEIVKEVKALW
ncbi:MAG: 2-oxoacid:acceptor oxidoreductase subunit alpha [bacterium]